LISRGDVQANSSLTGFGLDSTQGQERTRDGVGSLGHLVGKGRVQQPADPGDILLAGQAILNMELGGRGIGAIVHKRDRVERTAF
jgi:hypothetical protein